MARIGRPRETALRGTLEAVAALEPHLDALAAGLAGVGTESEARDVLERVQAQLESDTEVAGAIWRVNAKTHLAGQLFVRDIELKRESVSLDRTPPPTFLNLDFAEAIEHFARRRILSPEDFEALLDSERFRAFTVSRAVSEGVIRRAWSQIQAAMSGDGTGLADFIAELEGSVDGGGFPGGARRYLESVFRTSTATSYNAGRFRQQVEATEGDDTIVWQYVTAGDNRVRSSHRALDGKQWAVGDPEGRRVYPPNSFNCRCVMIVTEDRDEAAMQRAADAAEALTEGFDGAPGDAIEDEAARA